MIDTKDMDLEERKDLLYDIRDGRVKAEDVIWHNTFWNNSITNITTPLSCVRDEWWYYDSHLI